MKKLKSIRIFTRTGVGACIGLSLLSLCLLIMLGLSYKEDRDYELAFSTLISTLNDMLLDLNDLGYSRTGLQTSVSDEDEARDISFRLQESFTLVNNITRELGYPLVFSPLFFTSGDDPLTVNIREIHTYIDSARAQLEAVHDRNARTRIRIELILVVCVISVLIAILSLVIFLTRSLFRYYDSSSATLEQLERLVRMESVPSLSLPVRWTEELRTASIISELEGDLKFQRKLLNLPVAGTLEDFIPRLFTILKRFMPCNRIGVAFLDSFRNIVAETAVTDYETVVLTAGFREAIENTTLENLLAGKEPRIINDLPAYYRNVHQSDATRRLVQEGIFSSISMPLTFEGKDVGVLFASSIKPNAYTERHAKTIQWVINILKAPIFYSYILQELIAASARSFADIVEKKDYETGNHLNRVSLYAYSIASELSRVDTTIKPKFVREVYWFAPLHDIGKVGIPDRILLKPGRLLPEEFDVIRKHVHYGEEILQKSIQSHDKAFGMRFFDTALQIVSSHHERWDGSGYPQGIAGERIPLAGRIVALVDVFDALTSPRPYKSAFSFEVAADMIRSLEGTHFDPGVVQAFFRILPEIRRIYESFENPASVDTALDSKAV